MRASLRPTTVKYSESFALNLDSVDMLQCEGVNVCGGVLRGLNAYKPCLTQNNFQAIAGNDGDCCYVLSQRNLNRYHKNGALDSIILFGQPQPESTFMIHRNKAYLCFTDYGLARHDEDSWTLMTSQKLLSVASAGERVVVLRENGQEVWFGDSGTEKVSIMLNPSPNLTLATKCQALQSFNNNIVYALGPTCYKISFSEDLADIKTERIAQGLQDVVVHSVATVGDSIVFATVNGVYKLKNDKVTRIFNGLDSVITNYNGCRASFWRGYYALTFPCGQTRKAIVLDVDKQACLGVLYNGLIDLDFFDQKHHLVLTDGTFNKEDETRFYPAQFVRSAVDFGIAERKFLRRLNVVTKKDVDVYITDDIATRRVRIKGSKRMQSIPLNGQGRYFTLDIRSSGETEIDRFELIADVYKEAKYGSN